MPKRGVIALASTALAVVLLLNFKTPSETALRPAAADSAAIGQPRVPTAQATPAPAAGGLDPGGVSPTAPPAAGYADGQFTGQVVETRFGPVQVRVTISGGHLSDVQALQLPTDHMRSAEISQYAAPILRSEALQAQSAQIDLLSGATYTSDAYAQSLQSALDQAHG